MSALVKHVPSDQGGQSRLSLALLAAQVDDARWIAKWLRDEVRIDVDDENSQSIRVRFRLLKEGDLMEEEVVVFDSTLELPRDFRSSMNDLRLAYQSSLPTSGPPVLERNCPLESTVATRLQMRKIRKV